MSPFRRLFSDLSATAVDKIGTSVTGAAFFAIIALWMPKEEMGAYAYALSVGALAAGLLTLGGDTVTVRRIAAAPNRVRETIGTSLLQRLFFPTTALLVVAPLLPVLRPAVDHVDLMILAFAAASIGQVALCLRQVFVASRRFWNSTLLSQTAAIVRLLAGAATALLALGPAGLLLGLLLGYLFELILSAWSFRKVYGFWPLPRFVPQESLAFLQEGLPVAGTVLFASALARADWVLLGAMRPEVEVAEYSFAYRIFEISWMPHAIAGAVLLPRLAKSAAADTLKQAPIYAIAPRLVIAFSALPALILVGIWTPAIDWLTNGKYGAVNQTTILLLSAATPFAAGTGMLWNIMIANKATRLAPLVSATSLAINLIGNLMLIPKHGGVGAAMSASVTLGVQFFLYALSLRRSAGTGSLARTALLVTGGAVVAWLTAQQVSDASWAATTISLLLYLVLSSVLLRTGVLGFSMSDILMFFAPAKAVHSPRLATSGSTPNNGE